MMAIITVITIDKVFIIAIIAATVIVAAIPDYLRYKILILQKDSLFSLILNQVL